MPQYLLSIYQPDGAPPSAEILEPIMRDVAAVREEMIAAGVWVRADLLGRLGRPRDAAAAYAAALACSSNVIERRFLEQRAETVLRSSASRAAIA